MQSSLSGLTSSQEITLTTSTDPFFQSNYLATFGELGSTLKDYVQKYQDKSAATSASSINSIADMKRFVEEYPEFRKLGGNVSKHVALVGELSRLVNKDKLLEVGEIEQGLATSAGADFKVGSSSMEGFCTQGPHHLGNPSCCARSPCTAREQAESGNVVRAEISEDSNEQHCHFDQPVARAWRSTGGRQGGSHPFLIVHTSSYRVSSSFTSC